MNLKDERVNPGRYLYKKGFYGNQEIHFILNSRLLKESSSNRITDDINAILL